MLYINDDFTKQRGRKGASFSLPPKRTSFSPSCFLSTTNKTEETDNQKELVLPLLQK
jgi:hypothetical protein